MRPSTKVKIGRYHEILQRALALKSLVEDEQNLAFRRETCTYRIHRSEVLTNPTSFLSPNLPNEIARIFELTSRKRSSKVLKVSVLKIANQQDSKTKRKPELRTILKNLDYEADGAVVGGIEGKFDYDKISSDGLLIHIQLDARETKTQSKKNGSSRSKRFGVSTIVASANHHQSQ